MHEPINHPSIISIRAKQSTFELVTSSPNTIHPIFANTNFECEFRMNRIESNLCQYDTDEFDNIIHKHHNRVAFVSIATKTLGDERSNQSVSQSVAMVHHWGEWDLQT
mmetsp:Transcript_2788/g.5985  ORF Transcript_2788/g.5985 Transcript_2788/m.5985 type:complete len:108 (+) Transcript_2788:903-1226(+)